MLMGVSLALTRFAYRVPGRARRRNNRDMSSLAGSKDHSGRFGFPKGGTISWQFWENVARYCSELGAGASDATSSPRSVRAFSV